MKYAVDKILSLIGFLLLWPFIFLICLAILIEGLIDPRSRGPIIISQQRFSQKKAFPLYKFRTYFVSDDASLVNNVGSKKFIDHRRNTAVGRFLRKYYLDEIPQIANILAGQMSVVGPRPFPVKDYEDYLESGYRSKEILRGGLCGPIQSMKGEWSERVHSFEPDEVLIEEYMRRSAVQIVILDLTIMWNTLETVLKGEGF